MARKMALARVRRFLEPLLQERQVSWEQARPILLEMNSLPQLQGAVDNPERFMKEAANRKDHIGQLWNIMLLRPQLEPIFLEQGLLWKDMQPVLERLPRRDLKLAEEDPKTFIEDELQKKARGDGAKYYAIGLLRAPLEKLLPKGLLYDDIIPALMLIESAREILHNVESPDLLLWRLKSVKELTCSQAYTYIAKRPSVEPILQEGITWEDFLKVLQKLDPEQLEEAASNLDRFLVLLRLYPMDPPGKWWFMAQLRQSLELQLDTLGCTWAEAVEVMETLHPEFDLQPALTDTTEILKKLAIGPERLAGMFESCS